MNISKEKVYDVLGIQLQDIPSENWKWVMRLDTPDRAWTQKDIGKFMEIFNNYEDFEMYREDDTLEIHTADGNMVLELVGLPVIAKYCENEHFQSLPHEWYEMFELSHATIQDYLMVNFDSTIYHKKKAQLDEASLEWKDIGKYFHHRKAIGYLHKKSGVRYVMEMVRKGKDAYQTMKDASLSSQTIDYQLSVMMTPETKEHTRDILKEMIRHVMFLYQEFQNDRFPMVKEEQRKILQKYHKLIASSRDLNKYEQMNPSNYFLAPKPITLERKNLIEPDMAVGITSVLKNYAVTDKADGERMLFYVADNGKCYLINNTFQVRDTGIVARSNAIYNSLLDGEYIPYHIMKDSTRDVFAVFDIYYLNGDNVMKLPLMDSSKPNRYQKMEMVLERSFWNMEDASVSLELKRQYAADGKEMFAVCRQILEDKKRKYDIDGLIFTPTDLPVFAYYPNQFKKLKGKGMAWDKVLKWKPPEQNTIDFLVKAEEGYHIDEKTNRRYKRFKLYTGYNASQWEEIPVWRGLQRTFHKDPTNADDDRYEAKLFKPIEHYHPSISIAFVPVNSAGQPITENNEVIDDSMILEMSYNPELDAHPSMRWSALRIREDKTRLYRSTGQITKTANDLSVALNIWSTIHSPVTVEHIIGQTSVPLKELPADIEERMLGTNDVYYARDIPRNHMLSVHMLNFHNHGIKSMLYKEPPQKNTLLELACGMAGDLPRWRDNRYNFILGIDLVKNNIESSNGSYARYLNQRKEFFRRNQRGQQRLFYPQAVFLIGDCSLPLETGEASKGKDYDSEQVLKTLYQGKVYEKYNFLTNFRIPGKASSKFDVVSCQFAIHYFFRTQERLEGFLRNVSYNLKPNGRFIATFMDGQKVHTLINKEGKVEGRKGDSNSLVWAIQKQYKSFTKANPYGKLIDVFLENTNQFIPEYLVHFEVLKQKALEYHLEIVKDGFFEATFKELHEKLVKGDQNRNMFLDNDITALQEDPVQKRFSFLNRWVIFRKMEPGEVALMNAVEA